MLPPPVLPIKATAALTFPRLHLDLILTRRMDRDQFELGRAGGFDGRCVSCSGPVRSLCLSTAQAAQLLSEVL